MYQFSHKLAQLKDHELVLFKAIVKDGRWRSPRTDLLVVTTEGLYDFPHRHLTPHDGYDRRLC